MNARKYLSDNNYDPQTIFLGLSWYCSLEFNGRVHKAHGSSEQAALDSALKIVQQLELEEKFREQQERRGCVECGD